MAVRVSLSKFGAVAFAAPARGYASAAAAAATATAASNLPEGIRRAIEAESTLPNADPASDSQTARLVTDQLAYMVPTYGRPPPLFHKGQGCYMWDIENRKYLDFTAGIAVTSLGHSDPQIAEQLYQQANTIIHTSNLYHNPWTGQLSKDLIKKTLESGGMHNASRVFIANSGSEANEAAIKFARKVGKTIDPSGNKIEVVSFHNSFHGRTMGSLSATPNPKYQKPFGPIIPGFKYGTFNDINALPELINEKTCGVLVEPIQGEGGVNVASEEFLIALAKRCREVGAVLVHDEIQCGMGRTGKLWAHSILPKEAHPDILTTAKALGNGVPIGATIVNEHVSSKIVNGDHGTTFGGNPLACRVAHYCLTRLSDSAMHRDVVAKEQVFRKHFNALQKKFPKQIKEIRGRGLILGLELVEDPTPVVTAARERGLMIITCGKNTLRFVPPLVISEEEIGDGMRILGEAMDVVFKQGEQVEGTKGQQEMPPS